MSQERLARAARLHRTEISALERGAQVASISTLLIVANAVGVEPGDLVRGLPVPQERRSRAELGADSSEQSPSDRVTPRAIDADTEPASQDTGHARPRGWRKWLP